MKPEITTIVIEGGPCAGKTSGLAKVAEALVSVGIIPLVVPEAATLLINSGFAPWNIGAVEFQTGIANLQLHNEDVWLAAAEALVQKHGKSVVILCDRGLVGAAAYFPGEGRLEQLDAILKKRGLGVEIARARYKGVVHLVTAANGAEDYYTTANNTARKETLSEARELDLKTISAWRGHNHLAVVGNVDKTGKQISFDEKMRNVVAEVFRIIGYPQPIEIEDKYTLLSFDPGLVPGGTEVVTITQTYLSAKEGFSERVRVRSWSGQTTYFHTIKSPAPNGGRIEIERIISIGEYGRLLARTDLVRKPIRKLRYYFVWNHQYFEVDVFQGKLRGLVLLEREKTHENDTTELPPFLRVGQNVTGNSDYSNEALALLA